MGPFKHTVDDGLDIRKVDLSLIDTSFPVLRLCGRVSTNYLHMAVLIGGGGEFDERRETKNFSKDCIIYTINTPSP